MKKYKTVWIILGIMCNVNAFSQDTLSSAPVKNTFRNSQLINAQTTEMLFPRSSEFKIQHRFGEIDKEVVNNFLGLDLPANIRFSYSIPVTNYLSVGLGRTKYNKIVDLESKLRILHQTEKNEIPVSVAIYSDIGIKTGPLLEVTPDAFFSDSLTPFKNKFTHRLNYNTQIIIARKFNKLLSLQLTPVFIYHNLVDPGRANYNYVLQGSGRFRFAAEAKTSLIFEYAHIINDRTDKTINPLSVGVEYGTAGHVFQVVVSSTDNILESAVYTAEGFDYSKAHFVLGFNIKRTYWKKMKL